MLPLLVGLAIGSFVLALALRYPELDGFALGRSACPSCGSRIARRDLVPLVSWLALRGRCRGCNTTIGWHYPAAELAGATVAVWATTVFSGWFAWITCGLGWTLLALALIDLRCYHLPDFLTLPLLLAGLAVTWLVTPETIGDHLAGAVCGYGGLAAIGWGYRALRGRDGLGLGDAKLLGAAGAWLSWQALPQLILAAALLALGGAVVMRSWRGTALSATTRIAFGPYLAAAFWLFWLYAPLDFPL
ncbi:MAG: prepilin peptidase [Alphaproteobacteria bacterium]|nr:prepilin peptidase [Alphaproteobacteria bacterium]